MEQEDSEELNICVSVGKLNKKTFEVDRKIENCSGLFKTLSQTQGFEYNFEEVEPEEFEKCIEYLEMHDYNPPSISLPIKSPLLEENLCPKDNEFIKGYEYKNKQNQQLKKLISAANYLQINNLVNVCICRIATEFYFGTNQSSFEYVKQKHNVQKDITLQEIQRLNETYGWVEKQNN